MELCDDVGRACRAVRGRESQSRSVAPKKAGQTQRARVPLRVEEECTVKKNRCAAATVAIRGYGQRSARPFARLVAEKKARSWQISDSRGGWCAHPRGTIRCADIRSKSDFRTGRLECPARHAMSNDELKRSQVCDILFPRRLELLRKSSRCTTRPNQGKDVAEAATDNAARHRKVLSARRVVVRAILAKDGGVCFFSVQKTVSYFEWAQ